MTMFALIAVGVDGAAVLLAHECDGDHATSLPEDVGPWEEDETHWKRFYKTPDMISLFNAALVSAVLRGERLVAAEVRKSMTGCGLWHTWDKNGLNIDECHRNPKTVEEAKAETDRSLRSLDAWEIEFEGVGSRCPRELGLPVPKEPGLYVWSGVTDYGKLTSDPTDESGPEWRGEVRTATALDRAKLLRFLLTCNNPGGPNGHAQQ